MKIVDYDDIISNTWKQKSRDDEFGFSMDDPSIEGIDLHFYCELVIKKPKKHKKASKFVEIKDESIEESHEDKNNNKIQHSPSISPPRHEKHRSSSSSSRSSSPPRKRSKNSSQMNGLITAEEYSKNKEKEESTKHDISHIDRSLTGENAATIYRDKSGKKITKQSEIMLKTLKLHNLRTKEEEEREKLEWGLGKKQKEELEKKHEELERAKDLPFSVHADDIEYSAELKNELRSEDPMLEYTREKKNKKSNKPLYKGPAAPPNRYHIMPGYRWDGVDRSNGFERRYLSAQASRVLGEEEKYKYLTRDM